MIPLSHLLLFVLTFVCSVHAESSSRPLFINSTSTAAFTATPSQSRVRPPEITPFPSNRSDSANVTGVCCFVIQDTVSEEFWDITSYSTAAIVVNLTSLITYITQLPNLTTTRYETKVYTTNASFTFTRDVGRNPLGLFTNEAPEPTEAVNRLNGTAIETGGIVVPSPAAFYVYNTVKVITASPVTDEFGNIMCATRSAGVHGDIFTVNENAEAYYGGLGIYSDTQIPVSATTTTTTFTAEETDYVSKIIYTTTLEFTIASTSYSTDYVNRGGDTIVSSSQAGVTLTMDPPFIYQPERGKDGGRGEPDPCARDGNTENYGYVPQTVLDFLVQNDHYSKQYPGLVSCLPGGPSILQPTSCRVAFETTTVQQVGTDLTSSTIIYVGKPGVQQTPEPTPTPVPTPQPVVSPPDPHTKPAVVGTPYTVPPVKSTPIQTSTTQSLGAIIQSIFSNSPPPPSHSTAPPGQPITIPAATTIPISLAPPGAVGTSTNINGVPVIIIPGPQTIPPQPGAQPIGQPIVIPHATTIPVAGAPLGAQGETTVLHGTTYLIIPGPTTIAPPPIQSPAAAGIFPTSIIDGSPVLEIPGPTTIPLSLAPSGLKGSTTVISGTSYLVIAASTNVPAPATSAGDLNQFSLTTINNQPYLIIPATTLPQSLLPSGVTLPASESETVISGTTYLIIPTSTLVPAPITVAGVTVISGTTELVITGPTTMLVGPDFSVSGQTTVMSGSTYVVVSGATTVPRESTTRSSGSGKSTSSAGGAAAATSTSKAGAEPTASLDKRNVWIGVIGMALGGVAIGI